MALNTDAPFSSLGGPSVSYASYSKEEAMEMRIGPYADSSRSTDVSRAPAKQDAAQEGVRQKQIELQKSLKLIPFEKLDRAQEFANSGDAVPIVFCERVSNKGGAWVSPPLIDSASVDFAQTFVYLISQGEAINFSSVDDFYVGKYNVADLGRQGLLGTSLSAFSTYTDDPTVCPLSASDVTCNHNVFKILIDPLAPEVGSAVQFRSVDDYSTEARIKVKPIYPDGVSSPTLMETYVIRIRRTNNLTGTTTTVGTITTNNVGATSSLFTDTYSTGSYTHTFDVQSIAVAQTTKPAYILIEFRQENDFPFTVDRKASYADLTLLVVEGNLYDVKKQYSPPTDLKQLNVFMESGIRVNKWRLNPSAPGYLYSFASSNKFGDLALYFFEKSGKYPNVVNVQEVSVFDVATAARFHDVYDIFFNGVISNGTNFMSYAQSVAPMFLCAFYSASGFFRLKPLLPLTSVGAIDTGALTPKETFSDNETAADTIDNTIIVGSYQKAYFNREEREPIQLVVSFRGIRKSGVERMKTANVRYSDYVSNVPEEQYDMTEFCTTNSHATIFAKYVLATRRYSTHKVTFQTARNTLDSSFLQPTELIAVQLTRTNSEGDSRVETNHYLVDSIEYDQTGISTISATHFPLNGTGASIISNSVISGSFEVIV
jgi:hypothetical protein